MQLHKPAHLAPFLATNATQRLLRPIAITVVSLLTLLISNMAPALFAQAGLPIEQLMVAEDEPYGDYVVDGQSRPLYLFTADEGNISNCYDECAENWPPVLLDETFTPAEGAALLAGEEINPDLIGAITRTNGALQLTYNGHPLYYFVGDTAAAPPQGQDIHSFGGEWYLISPAGEPIEVEAEGGADAPPQVTPTAAMTDTMMMTATEGMTETDDGVGAIVLEEGEEPINAPVDQPLRATALGIYNQRVNKEAAITSENVNNLQMAWRVPITHPVSHTPLVDNGRVYFADWGGTVYAADAATGAILWQNKVEEPMMMWPWHGFAGTGAIDYDNGILIEASVEGSAFGLDLETGELLWETQVAEQELGGNLSDLLYYDGLVYIGLSSPSEALDARMAEFIPQYQGNVVALNSTTGEEVWRTYTVEEPMNGATVWSSFALDPDTETLFFPTSNNYTGSPSETSDAMFAVDAKSGDVLWFNQVTEHDTWTRAVPVGPDYAFGAGAQLFEAQIDGETRQLVGAGQKSGIYYAWDRATGDVVWSTFVGYPQVGGGIRGEAGIGAGRIYVWSNNSYLDGQPPEEYPITVKALDAATGRNLWFHDKAQPAIGTAAGFLANDVFFVGSLDGTLQAYDADNGEILWQGSTPGAVASSLVVVSDTLYVGAGVPALFGGGPDTNGMFAFSLAGAGQAAPDATEPMTATGVVSPTNQNAPGATEPLTPTGTLTRAAGLEYNLVYNDPFSQNATPAWYQGALIQHLNLGITFERPPYPIADQYLFVYEDAYQEVTTEEGFFNLAMPLLNAGQHVIFDSVPGDPNYSPIWRNYWVLVPRDYEINSLRSEEAVLASGFRVIPTDIYLI